ncbi:hypothetical protein K492DRAFT_193698 [Lichtheimia hyalospora FSU 10163]|nr:hypothetical protein K492DRAFT_193698 [Lichtheimia hyalospora FSU 10163]
MRFLPVAIICALISATSITAETADEVLTGNTSSCKGRTDEECQEPECRRIENKILGRADDKPFHESNAPIIWGFNYCEDPDSQNDRGRKMNRLDEPVVESDGGLGGESENGPEGGLKGNINAALQDLGKLVGA